MDLKGWGFDIESDSLYLQSKSIWYMHLKTLDGARSLSIRPFEKTKGENYKVLMEWINSFEDGSHVVSFNGLGFDLWMLWKFFGIQPRVGKNNKDWLGGKHVQYVDGYILSQ